MVQEKTCGAMSVPDLVSRDVVGGGYRKHRHVVKRMDLLYNEVDTVVGGASVDAGITG